MTIFVTGQEFKAFYDDPSAFPDGTYHDDVLLYVDDEVFMGDVGEPATRWANSEVRDIPDTAKVRLVSGVVVDSKNGIGKDFVGILRSWLKKRSTAQLIVSVPKERLEELKAAIRTAGGRIEG